MNSSGVSAASYSVAASLSASASLCRTPPVTGRRVPLPALSALRSSSFIVNFLLSVPACSTHACRCNAVRHEAPACGLGIELHGQVVRNGFVIWDDLDQQVSCSVEHVRDPVIDDVLRGFLACDVNQPLEALGLSVPYGTASSAFADWTLACNRWSSDHCVEM